MTGLFKRGVAGLLVALTVALSFGQAGGSYAQPALRQLVQTPVKVRPDAALVSSEKFVLPRGKMGTMGKGVTGNILYDRNLTQVIIRTRTIAPMTVRVTYTNSGMDNDYTSLPWGEQCGPNAITIRASVERLGTTNVLHKFTFGGSDSVTLQPCETVTSDPLTAEVAFGLTAGSAWPSNNYFAMKTETVTPSLGGVWPAGFVGGSTVNTGGVTGTRNDQTLTCNSTDCGDQIYSTGAFVTTGGVTNISGHVPIAYTGTWPANTVAPPSIVWFGDSIADNAYGGAFNYFGAGGIFLEQAVRSAQVPYSRYAMGSMEAAFYQGRNTAAQFLMAHATTAYMQLGTNGLSASGTHGGADRDQIDRDMIRDARLRGVKDFILLPILPSTASTDGGATNANQTYRTNFAPGAQRDVANAFRRAGVGKNFGATALVDSSAPMEDPADRNKFLSNGTPNSIVAPNDAPSLIHPNLAGHTLMAAPVLTDMQGRSPRRRRVARRPGQTLRRRRTWTPQKLAA